MGYAKHVGRVGALAVLLGIGTAIASPAVADTATSSSDTPSESSVADSAPSTPTTDTDEDDADAIDLDDGAADEVDELDEVDDADEVDELDEVDDADEVDDPDEVDEADEVDDAAEPDDVGTDEGQPKTERAVAEAPAEEPAEEPSDETEEEPAAGVEERGSADTGPADRADDDASARVETTAAPVVAESNPPGTPAPAPLLRQPVTPIGVLLGAPFKLIGIAVEALDMLFTPAPTTPADPPTLWGVMAFVHREIHRTFFNSSPHAVADSATTSEDVPTTIPVLDNDTDPNADPLTIKKYTQPANGTVALNPDGTFTYTPNADFNGTDTFTYTVSDEAGAWHVHNLVSLLFRGGHAPTTTVTIAVGAVNDPPTMNPDRPVTDSVTGAVTANLNAADVDGDPLTFDVSAPSRGDVTIVDGAFVYTPTAEARAAAGQGGPATDTFTVTVDDGNGGTVSQTFTVAVTPNIDNITIEMRWGATPTDLDSHLVGPSAGGGDPFHIYYVNRNLRQADGTLTANLAADDINGFGPELTTIYTRTPGEYLFYVHRYSTDAGLDVSEASVTVRDSVSGINTVFTISDEATARYWSVFTLTISDTGLVTVTPVDTYSETAPTLPTASRITL